MKLTAQVHLCISAAMALLVAAPARAQEPTAEQVLARYKAATYYAGKDFQTRMLLEIFSADGKQRIREITEVRRTPKTGDKYKIYLFFHQPEDVKRMAMIIWVDPDKADDRWVFVPAIDAIRRIAAMDEQEKFVGSDFTYEDGSGHDVSQLNSKRLADEKVNGRDCWVVESVPRKVDKYSRLKFWIDKKTALALRYEYYDRKGALWKVASSEAMQVIKAGETLYPTQTKVVMKDVQSGGHSIMWYKDVVYDQGIQEADFTESNLRTPPRAWVK